MQICIKCGCEYEQFNTSHGKPSMRCLKCNKNQAEQDAKVAARASALAKLAALGLTADEVAAL